MPIDYSLLKFAKGQPKVIERHAKTTKLSADLKACYDAVDVRDGKRCQVRGTSLSVGAVDEWKALERHHLEKRSASKARRADVDNVLTVSRGVHALLESSALIPVDAKGKETTRVSKIAGYRWNRRMVPATKEPFRLKREAAA